MSVVEALSLLGGVATRATLIKQTSRAEVDAALAAGEVVARARGRYALPEVEAATAVAHDLTAVVSHRSAAAQWGWGVKELPDAPDVIVAKSRRLSPERAKMVTVHRAALHDSEVVEGRTSKERTIVDCLRTLPEDEALAVADSALRAGESHRWLVALARDVRGAGADRVRRIAALASEEAANPFESCLRWLALQVAGLQVRPQVSIHAGTRFLGRSDLVDQELRIVLEADSFEWHGGRADLARDARRYNAMVVAGWLVLRFSWDDVMHHPDVVLDTLREAVAARVCRHCGAVA